ncbi:hypothetical protein TNCV_686991 [Trichonephila clavipes]|nr:hypothetical protein TNCV_686991 [Trichonephila clavipes]
MAGATKYPPSTRSLNQWVRKSCGLNRECRGLENVSLPFSSIPKMCRWRSVVSPSIVPSGNFAELIRTVTCKVLKANDRRTSGPLTRLISWAPRSDYSIDQGESETTTVNIQSFT